MKILMIGGTRFFGKRFVQLMLDEGYAVTLLTRGQSTDDFGNKVSRLVADRTNQAQLKNVVKSDYDVVVDNMLMNAQEANDVISVFRDRTDHYVMTSTLSVYNPQSEPLYETDFEAINYIPKHANHPSEAYQQGKRAAEHALTQAPFGMSIMRIPLIVGPEDYTERLLTHVKSVREGSRLYFPNPDAKFSYLHAHDAARALKWLSTSKPKGTFNVAAPNAWTLQDLMNTIGQIVGQKATLGNVEDSPSPFGIENDFYMNVEKAHKEGFRVNALEDWLPTLIEDLLKK